MTVSNLRPRLAMVRDGAGLTDVELSALLGVSRTTLFFWTSGRYEPRGPLKQRLIAFTLEGLCAAMHRGLLPLPAALERSARAARLAGMRTKLIERFYAQPGG